MSADVVGGGGGWLGRVRDLRSPVMAGNLGGFRPLWFHRRYEAVTPLDSYRADRSAGSRKAGSCSITAGALGRNR